MSFRKWAEDQSWNDFKALYLIKADGDYKIKLSQEAPFVTSYGPPVWLPDGKWIAACRQDARFLNGRGAIELLNRDLWVMSPDGVDAINLTNTATIDESSPIFLSHSRIAFDSVPRSPQWEQGQGRRRRDWEWEKARWLVVDIKSGKKWVLFPKGISPVLGVFQPYRGIHVMNFSD